MISKKFYINILIRIILILVTCISIVPFFAKDEKLFTILSLIILLTVQVYALIKYINKFNREIAYFFSTLKTNDVSYAFHDKSFPYITENLRKDIEYVRNQIFSITRSKEIQESYLKTLIENTQTGIISCTEDGKVDIINQYALNLLNINRISNIKVLQEIHPGIYQFIINAVAGDEKMIMIKGKSKSVPVAARITEFKQKSEKLKLVSFQNIESELNEKELLSWHKLIRVLTHEINNSISPISSLSNSLEKLYTKENRIISKKEISENIIQKTSEGLQLITKRGEGLINFVNSYKTIASLKQMDFENIKVAELFYNLELLMKNQLAEKNIDLKIDIRPFDLEIYADKKYIEQICINLIKNSIEAINNNQGVIQLIAGKDKNEHKLLKIIDNGKGIVPELIDQIFVPFFTTKENGSGIGLSLARQIMQHHGGNISVNSIPANTAFTLHFN